MLRLAFAAIFVCVSVVALAVPRQGERAGHERAALPGFSVTPPPGDDWYVADQAYAAEQMKPKVVYGTGFGRNSTALAAVYAFVYPAHIKDPQDVFKLFAERNQRSGPRTQVRSSTSERTTIAGAPCVRMVTSADDTGVQGHEDEVFALTKWNLVCMHPQYPSFIVNMDYSERLEPGLQSPIAQETRDGFLNSLKFEPLERRVDAFEIGAAVLSLAVDAGSVWVTSGYELDGKLTRIDARSNAVVARIPVGKRPTSLAAYAGAVWVVNTLSDNVMRIDPATNKVTATVAVGKTPAHIAGGFGSLWVTNNADGTVTRIDPATLATTVVNGIGQGPMAIVATETGIFASDPKGFTVVRIDPATNSVVQTFARGIRATYLIADGATLWATDLNDDSVVQIATDGDPRIVRRIKRGFDPGRMVRAGPDLWVTSSRGDEIVAFNLSENDPAPRRIPSAPWPLAIVESGGTVWVGSFRGEAVLRLDPA
ncbi:MAG: YncE family protein [Alphaproteobacteria bacterium]|nr:YncE family protein [Alphaproteobacteria bacterium]